MLQRRGTNGVVDTMVNAAKLLIINQVRTIASPHSSANPRPPSSSSTRSMNTNFDPHLHNLFQQKQSVRSKVRTRLKNMDPILRSQEDDAIQQVVLEAPWFKNSSSIGAYISADALREVDTSRIVSDILSNPTTGLAFDKCGSRLGRSGGYYDMFLKKYHELIKKQNWKLPLLVALSYSVQIIENEGIPTTPYDVPVDALVSASGFIPINPVAFKCCH